jgi:hypothetical protein
MDLRRMTWQEGLQNCIIRSSMICSPLPSKYYQDDQIRGYDIGGICSAQAMRNAYMIFVGKRELRRPLGRPRRRWEDNIKMDLREKTLDCADWIHMDQDRDWWRALVNTVMNLWGSIKGDELLE